MIEKQILLCDENFSAKNSAWFTLTFRKDKHFDNYEDVKKEINKFLRKLKREYKKEYGVEKKIKYSAIIHKGSKGGRFHCHALISILDRNFISKCWGNGYVFQTRIKTESLRKLVRYMANRRKESFETKNEAMFINSRKLETPNKREYFEHYKLCLVLYIASEIERITDLIKSKDKKDIAFISRKENRFCGKYVKINVDASVYFEIIKANGLEDIYFLTI